MVLFIFVAAGFAVFILEMPEIGRFLPVSSEMGDPSNAKIIDFERRIELLERKTNDLTLAYGSGHEYQSTQRRREQQNFEPLINLASQNLLASPLKVK